MKPTETKMLLALINEVRKLEGKPELEIRNEVKTGGEEQLNANA